MRKSFCVYFVSAEAVQQKNNSVGRVSYRRRVSYFEKNTLPY